MQQRRLLMLLGLVLLILTLLAVVAVWFLSGGLGNGTTPSPDATADPNTVVATPVQIDTEEIVAAAVNIERGQEITAEMLKTITWPKTSLPEAAVNDVARLVGQRARYTILNGQPIFTNMVVEGLDQLPPFGSDAAVRINKGAVAISLPYDLRNGAAGGIEAGDAVNVIVSWALLDIDEDFQSVLPNLSAAVVPPNTPLSFSQAADGQSGQSVNTTNSNTAVILGTGPQNNATGREEAPVLNQPVYVVPQEPQRSRLVSQSIIQNALVLQMGQFKEEIDATPVPTAGAPVEAPPGSTPTPPPPPTATPLPPDIITIIVSPQEALVIDWVNRMKQRYPDAVNVTLVLRAAGDTTTVETQSVTLQYMFEQYNISLPSKLTYGLDTKPLPTATPRVLTP
jgi:pilus assembly protein CpaB